MIARATSILGSGFMGKKTVMAKWNGPGTINRHIHILVTGKIIWNKALVPTVRLKDGFTKEIGGKVRDVGMGS